MAVFSDTAKRLWGLYLMPTLLVAPDLEYSPLERGGFFPLLTDAGPPDALRITAQVSLLTND